MIILRLCKTLKTNGHATFGASGKVNPKRDGTHGTFMNLEPYWQNDTTKYQKPLDFSDSECHFAIPQNTTKQL